MNVTDQLVEVMARAMLGAYEGFDDLWDNWVEGMRFTDTEAPGQEGYRSMARAALTALRKAEEEVGLVTVPREPTRDMLLVETSVTGNWHDASERSVWQAMLSAAPLPPGSTE